MYALLLWGALSLTPVGGRTSREEAMWQAARDEESARRLWWNWDMRKQGWGNDAAAWLLRWEPVLVEWDLCDDLSELKRDCYCFCLRDPSHWLRVATTQNSTQKPCTLVASEWEHGVRMWNIEFGCNFVMSSCFISPLWARCPPAVVFLSVEARPHKCWTCPFVMLRRVH
jgi:hypothetical protein